MKFYSELTRKLYDTEAELTEAENVKKQEEEEAARKAEEEKAKQEAKMEAKKARESEIEEARKRMIAARAEYTKLIKEFGQDYYEDFFKGCGTAGFVTLDELLKKFF